MKVPRKYMGTQGNNLLNNLASQATSKGLPVKLGETVNVSMVMGGSITNPSIKTALKEAAGDMIQDAKEQVINTVQQRIDSTKQVVKDSLKEVKKQVVEGVKDELKNKLFGKDTTSKADSTPKKKPAETIKNTLGNLLNKKKKAPADSTKQ
jgi:hypothetical protein